MITFRNGHRFDFGCASGALAFRGNGWWFEQPWRWLRWLRPSEMTIITKTLTPMPVKGNLNWRCPWRSVRYLGNGSYVNAVALTNPGLDWWIDRCYPYTQKKGYKVIVSILPTTYPEARKMVGKLNRLKIVGIELNASCPNTGEMGTEVQRFEWTCNMTKTVALASQHPTIVKLAYQDWYVEVCEATARLVDAFELINTVPFKLIHPHQESPLERYHGMSGGISGRLIINHAREALMRVRAKGVKRALISGGGIDTITEVLDRERLGANGFVFGSVFIRQPWLPNQIIEQYRNQVINEVRRSPLP